MRPTDGLMPFQEQLEMYPQLKQFFTQRPIEHAVIRATRETSPPWRVWVQRATGSTWGKRDFCTYAQAFEFWKKYRRHSHDASVSSKRQSFVPPERTVKVVKNGEPVMVKSGDGTLRQQTRSVPLKPPSGHQWCVYCRRFTIFAWFRQHHAFDPKNAKTCFDSSALRCAVCGVSERTGAFRA